MTMAKKTIDIDELITWVNTRCAVPSSSHRLTTNGGKDLDAEQAFRLGVASLLEQALHATGNYRGFSYNDTEMNGDGALRPDYDETRRHYSR
jgi:hypothetical protein